MKKGQMLINANDIIGKRLGKLKVIAYVGYKYDNTAGGKRMRHYYACECDCGKIYIAQRGPLLNEIVHSCGCGKRRETWLLK